MGRPLDDDRQLLEAMRSLNARGARWVVITQGAGPVWVTSAEQTYRFRPLPAEHVVNPIGSGDAMAAAMAWAIRAGRPMVEAVQLGMAAAAENLATWRPAGSIRPAFSIELGGGDGGDCVREKQNGWRHCRCRSGRRTAKAVGGLGHAGAVAGRRRRLSGGSGGGRNRLRQSRDASRNSANHHAVPNESSGKWPAIIAGGLDQFAICAGQIPLFVTLRTGGPIKDYLAMPWFLKTAVPLGGAPRRFHGGLYDVATDGRSVQGRVHGSGS